MNIHMRRKAAKERAKKDKAAAEKKALEAKLDALPKSWLPKDCDPGEKGRKARVECLERLKLRSPDLSFEDAAAWATVRDNYAKYVEKVHKAATGAAFVARVNRVLQDLKEHYTGKSPFNQAGQVGGDPMAFYKFFVEMKGTVPKPVSCLTL